MRTTGRVRPSKPASFVGMIVGAIFVGIGVFMIIPEAGVFGVIWTLMALLGAGYHAANVFSEHGVAHGVVDFDTASPAQLPSSAGTSLERRLSKLDELKRQGLVSEEEYSEQRRRILDDL